MHVAIIIQVCINYIERMYDFMLRMFFTIFFLVTFKRNLDFFIKHYSIKISRFIKTKINFVRNL